MKKKYTDYDLFLAFVLGLGFEAVWIILTTAR